MAPEPGRPGPSSAAAAPYAVAVEALEVLSGRVRAAATTTDELASRPALLPAAVERAGSSALAAAARSFGDAWTRECTALARETLMVADALGLAADQYRSTEWAAGASLSAVLRAAVDAR